MVRDSFVPELTVFGQEEMSESRRAVSRRI